MEFLGHTIGEGAISPQEQKIQAIINYKKPVNESDVRSFLGLVNYYSDLIQNCSAIAAPLTDLTRKSESDIIRWTSECQAAFKNLKQAMASAPVLRPTDYNLPFILQTDASDKGVGAVLSQIEHEKDHPIYFFSKKLLVKERKNF